MNVTKMVTKSAIEMVEDIDKRIAEINRLLGHLDNNMASSVMEGHDKDMLRPVLEAVRADLLSASRRLATLEDAEQEGEGDQTTK